MIAAIVSTNADWYLMRASGFVALILLTISVCLGIANLARLAKGPWTRTVSAIVHRNTSLLAVVFVAIHVLTSINDKYVNIPIASILIPGLSGYDPVWVGIGAVSVDLLVAVTLTSVIRGRLPHRTWQVVHWLAYLCWPTAFLHSIGSGSGRGTDTGTAWSTAVYVTCGVCFSLAAAARLWLRNRPAGPPPPQPPKPAATPLTAGARP